MENTHIIPSKIHLMKIVSVREHTVQHDEKLDVKPSYNIEVSHSMMHNLEKELVKIRLYVDISAEVHGKNLNQGGNYEVDFIFKVDDLKDHYQITNEKPLFGGLFVSTLLAISYSTLRGMLFTLWKDTYLSALILPIINVPDLLKNKR
jgi:DNA-dependent RNA polymerase auxiliary subunit epsilon